MKKMSKGLLLVFMIALTALFLSCTTTGTNTKSAAAKAPMGKLFENASPEFSVRYPSSWTKGKLNENDYFFIKTGPYELPNMRVTNNLTITTETTPEQAAERAVNAFIKNYKAKNCKVLVAKAITLADGTPAIETEIRWNHPNVVLFTSTIQAKKGDTGVTVSITDMTKVSEKNKAYQRTLAIK